MDATLAEALADIDALKAHIVKVENERDQALHRLRQLAEIVQGAAASISVAADALAPAYLTSPTPRDAGTQLAPVLNLPMRHDSKKAAAAPTTTADQQPTQA